jgi:hypothetical protein
VKIGITNRGSTALKTWVARTSRASAVTASASEASTCATLKRSSPVRRPRAASTVRSARSMS